MAKERRTHKFINRNLQIRIAGEIILHSILFLALVCLLLFAPPFVTWFSNYSIDDHQAIAKELFILNASKWPLFLLLAIFLGIVSVLFSHHIAGPMYHVSRVIGELKARNLAARVRFRKWDYLSDLEAGFNESIAVWQEDVRLFSNCFKEMRGQMPPEKAKELETILKEYRGID
ncbi:MAG: hypothetical protein V1798_07785 [Pseudomonadota bacterium]